MPDLRGTFRKPFPEQVAAFRNRLGDLVPTRAWDDLRHDAHDRAFVVAGAMKADLLADLGAAVERSIADGQTLETFRRDFREIVERRGWHGWTGEGTAAGEAWRTRVIYRTNARTSYAAGRLAQLKAGGFKYWVYRHGGAVEPRPHHLALDGLILPADHPVWAKLYPPNDWGCSCYVVGARSMRGAIRLGGRPEVTLPDDWATPNPKTGTPLGIGKGWDYAPGGSAVDAIQALVPKLDRLPPQPSVALIQDWLRWDAFGNWLKAPEGHWPLVRLPAHLAEEIGADGPVAVLPAGVARKQLRNHPELTVREYLAAQSVVDEADEVIRSGSRGLVFVTTGPDGVVLVVEAARSDGQLIVLSYRRLTGTLAEIERQLRRLRKRNEER